MRRNKKNPIVEKLNRIERHLYISDAQKRLRKKHKYPNVRGKLHAMRFRFSFFEFLLTVLPLFVVIINFLDKNKFNVYLAIAFIISLSLPLFNQLYKYIKLMKEKELFVELPNEKINETKNLPLPKSYQQNGYEYFSFNTSNEVKYIMSHSVNEHLNLYDLDIGFDTKKSFAKKFVVPKSLEQYVPFALKKYLNGEESVFNGVKLKQMTDIYTDTVQMKIQKTDYFANLTTNELIYKKIKNNNKLGEIFYGNVLAEGKEGGKTVLCNLDESQCANIIGVDTLAVTKDNYLIINRQGKRSFVAKGKYVPSGSGSAEKVKLKKDMSFTAALKDEMERELKEELNLNSKTKIITDIIGYARLVDKGGKADFFGVSYIDSDKASVEKCLAKSKEIKKGLMGEPCYIKVNDLSIDTVFGALEAFIDKNKQDCSVQLEITKESLRGFKDKNREVFAELENKFLQRDKVFCFSKKGEAAVNEDAVNFNNNYYWVLDGATPLGKKATDFASDASFLTEKWNHYMLIETAKNDYSGLDDILKKVFSCVKADFEEAARKQNSSQPFSYASMSAAFAKVSGKDVEVKVFGDIKVHIKASDSFVSSAKSKNCKMDEEVIAIMIDIANKNNITVGQARHGNCVKEKLLENRKNCCNDIISLEKNELDTSGSQTFLCKNATEIIMMSDGYYAHSNFEKEHNNVFDKLNNARRITSHYKKTKNKMVKDVTLDKYPRFKILDDASILYLKLS